MTHVWAVVVGFVAYVGALASVGTFAVIELASHDHEWLASIVALVAMAGITKARIRSGEP